ncbi:DUF861 domain-containing protein [Cytophagales bacterium RKSG123]|nr:DUF861 domain-containing protein [Xanthovirga aplysinae]
MVLEPRNGKKYSFSSGDYIIGTKGYQGKWTTVGATKYHLELSVISNKRTDSTQVSAVKNPFHIDKQLISGIGLQGDGKKRRKQTIINEVFSGIELDVSLVAEKSREREITYSKKEQMFHILIGMVTITPHGSDPQTFYQGDFFVLPKGFNGTWKAQGHDLFRTIRVMQSE